MNALDLIKQYDLAVEQENAQRAQEEADTIQNAREQFLAFCRVWLGEFWDEFQPGELKHRKDTSWSYPQIRLYLPVSFMNVPGEVEGVYMLNHQRDQWSNLSLDFGTLDMGEHNQKVYITFGLGSGKAQPIDPRDMGALLSKIARHVPFREENERKYLEQKRADVLVFHGNDIPGIEKEISVRTQEFPDLAEQIRAAGQKAIDVLNAREEERKQENARYVAQQEERDRLNSLIARAWKKPFTVYKVSFGGWVGNGEGGVEVCAESIYTLSPEPDPEGYYLAFHQGKLSRRIRPEHRISTEILMVENDNDCPYELQRYGDIKSKHFPDVSVYAALPPAELVPFDVDAPQE